MADIQDSIKEDEPHIYIPYDSTIDLKLEQLQLIYEKNSNDQILGLNLNHLNIVLK